MKVTVNGQEVEIPDSDDKIIIHVPGDEWHQDFLGHRVDEMDVVLTR